MGRLIPSIFRHVQSTPSTSWTIVHGLGGNGGLGVPIVDVSIDNGVTLEKIIPEEVAYTDKNTVVITFTEVKSGEAMIMV